MTLCEVDALFQNLLLFSDQDGNGTFSVGDLSIPIRLTARRPGDLFIFNLEPALTDALTLAPGESKTFLIHGLVRQEAPVRSRHGSFRRFVDAARFQILESGYSTDPFLGASLTSDPGQVFHLPAPDAYLAYQFENFGTYDRVTPLGQGGDVDQDACRTSTSFSLARVSTRSTLNLRRYTPVSP